MKIVFPLTECTFLRYFAPVACYARERGHEVHFSLYPNSKYNNPLLPENNRKCREVMDSMGIQEGSSGDVCVCVEGIKFDLAPISYSLTYMYDFAHLYSGYIDKVDHVVFPSEYVAKAFECVSNKNLYFGSPKYDTPLEYWARVGAFHNKYNLNPSNKYALVMYPRSRDMHKIDISKVCEDLMQQGYTPILKTRGKDPIRPEHKHYVNFGDESWFPHTTAELISICDKIVNTGSSMIKEAVMLGKGNDVINYNIKPSSCVDLPELYEEGAREKYLDPGGRGRASEAIIQHMEKNYG